MKKIFGLIVVILIAVLLIVGGSKKGNKEVVRIGVIGPITGNYSAYGATFAKGVQIALKQLDQSNTRYRYEVIIEDDAGSQANAASAANKLINIDKVKAIFTTTSGTGNAVKSLASTSKIIHVCDCTDVSISDAPYNFTNLILPSDEARAWIDEALKRGNKTVALISQIHPGAKALSNSFISKIASSSLKVVFSDSVDGSAREFNTLIAKAKRSNPDIYLIISYPPALDIISKELINSGEKNISTFGLFTTSPTPELYEGLWFTDAALTDNTLKADFIRENPNIRFNGRTVPYAYDIFNMFVKSMELGGDTYQNLMNINEYDGKVGKITKNLNSRTFMSDPAIWIYKNGEFVQVNKS
jgi:ABC-type branched-subunit amino acid transport system substrate-binding protein